ncbi:MAG: hypothetical protein NZ929_03545 [Aigarchaeota archaeon]|nr:hypothetical protein [Aigarchaeota archaeon]MCX8192844.1 hypothetical protein [Nitrososphaeria archaeon]MDW7986088.1 hypothetical protein [Nitrososphaerota archaeon]
MDENFKIVRVTDRESFKQLEAFQSIVWGRGEVIPYHVLIAFQNMGGIVLVAYDESNRPVGLLCGYNSYKDGKVFYYMHLCGVLPEYSGSELTVKMKIKMREHLLREGIEHAVWLIDPLNVMEAYVSIHKLRGLGESYQRNFYGLMRDPYNRGLESDRLLIKWNLKSKEVEEKISCSADEEDTNLRLDELDKSIIILRDGSFPRILDYKLNLNSEKFYLEIPMDLESIKKRDLSVAIEWREVTRRIFENYMSKGYLITDVIRDLRNSRYYYVFEKCVRDYKAPPKM